MASLALNAADAGLTRSILAGPHGREDNPVVAPFAASTGGLLAYKAAVVAGAELLARHEEARGHRTTALVVRLAAVAVPAFAVVHNVGELGR